MAKKTIKDFPIGTRVKVNIIKNSPSIKGTVTALRKPNGHVGFIYITLDDPLLFLGYEYKGYWAFTRDLELLP